MLALCTWHNASPRIRGSHRLLIPVPSATFGADPFRPSSEDPVANSKLPAAMKLAEDRNLRFVSLQFTDIVGQVKSVQVPMHQLEEAVERGKWFDGSSIEGFARIAESDMFLVPDL